MAVGQGNRTLASVALGLVCGPLLGVFVGCLLAQGMVDRDLAVGTVLVRVTRAGVFGALRPVLGSVVTPPPETGLEGAGWWALLSGALVGGVIPALAVSRRAAFVYWTLVVGPALLFLALEGTPKGAWPMGLRFVGMLCLWLIPAVLVVGRRIYSR
jgi:hypothetical protein